jgi:hypothetical protein
MLMYMQMNMIVHEKTNVNRILNAYANTNTNDETDTDMDRDMDRDIQDLKFFSIDVSSTSRDREL